MAEGGKPKLTDAQRYKRFVEMAREVEVSKSPKAFDKAFKRVTGESRRPQNDRKAKAARSACTRNDSSGPGRKLDRPRCGAASTPAFAEVLAAGSLC